ncbi:MAG: hypothetical protein WD904_02140 [Dehalococcoidia bacterium]
MKTKLLLALALCQTLALLTALGCGDDDGNTPGPGDPTEAPVLSDDETEYMQALATELATVNEQLENLDQFRSDAFSAGANPSSAVSYGAAYVAYETARRDGIIALTSPDSLSTLHAALLASAEDNVAFANTQQQRLGESPPATEQQYQSLFFELDGSTITQRFRDACGDLQARASAAGLDVDLACLR